MSEFKNKWQLFCCENHYSRRPCRFKL